MKFNDMLYESLFDHIVKQGGNAVSNVERIQKAYINPTIQKFYNIIIKPLFPDLIFGQDIFLLGSTGKKASSGDIDIGIDFKKIQRSNTQTIMDQLKNIFIQIYKSGLAPEIKINQITNDMIHISFPQYNEKGEQTGKLVQIDILLTPYKEFCQFYMYSPTEQESKYKGAHRNELLRGIIKTITYKPLKKIGNEIVKWKQYDLNSMGLYDEQKTIVDDKGKRLKYKDTNQDLIPAYAKCIYSKPLLHKPIQVIHLLVGQTYKESDIDTFEKLFNIISNDSYFKYDKLRYQILHNTAISIQQNSKLVFPDELIDYLDNGDK